MRTSIIKILLDFGFDIAVFFAGLAGGIAFLTKSPKLSKIQKFTSVLSGGFAANYLTPLVGNWLNLNMDTLYGISFLIGYGGLKFVETLYIYLSRKFVEEKNDNK